eukprot:TRINITY_DN6708_c0_g1_i1.p1 TRINITY_DN6708_c0_g1~~TRINITY_DN6708_c0_g1_i1.p1  ORF type:complete len:509 (+),score=95.14 TRINITY_DN6708_c0_g1_i1:207-1733(+)
MSDNMWSEQGKGTSKKGIDIAKNREKRGDDQATLRKHKKQQDMNKKRRETESSTDIEPNMNDLPKWKAQLFADDYAKILEATTWIRRYLALEEDPPIDEISSNPDIVRRLVELLGTSEPALQFEAAWSLTNIASGTSENTRAVVQARGIEAFAQLLLSGEPHIVEQAIWALGNIVGEEVWNRDHALKLGVLPPIIAVIVNDPSISMLRNATWTLSNLCRGKPIPSDIIRPAVQVLTDHVLPKYDSDDRVIIDVCWALSYVTDGPNYRIQWVLDSGIVPHLVELLPRIGTPALRTLGNIVTGSDVQTQIVVDAGILPKLHDILQNYNSNVRREVCWCISNIAAGSHSQIQEVISTGLIVPVIAQLTNSTVDVRKEAGWIITNVCHNGTSQQVQFVVSEGAISALCSLFTLEDVRASTIALEGIMSILKVGEAAKERSGSQYNEYALAVESCGGHEQIEALIYSRDVALKKTASMVMRSYFEQETRDPDEPVTSYGLQRDLQAPPGGYSC